MNANGAMIEVEGLTRSFGAVRAVDRLSFTIPTGRVTGFIGANGAGKTTTMRILATLDQPDGGHVRINGRDVQAYPNETRRCVGWMPDDFGAYPDMSVWEYMDFFARMFDLRRAEREARVADVMDFTDLKVLADRPCNVLSKGQTQRLCLGRTLLHDPPVLILDEPAAGLDPKARLEFKRLIKLLQNDGKTIFISSHILSELGEMCDTLLFIDNGRLVHFGDADSLRYNRAGGRSAVEIRVNGDPDRLMAWIQASGHTTLDRELENGAIVEVDSHQPEALSTLLKTLIDAGLPVCEFHRHEVRLEDAFVEMLRDPSSMSPSLGTAPFGKSGSPPPAPTPAVTPPPLPVGSDSRPADGSPPSSP
ncbi:MAG: ABC transporter ATP-binding protein [Opitutales bacterium]